MWGVADYGAFVVAIVLFLMIPGPGNLALITSTGQSGPRAGLATMLGMIAADQVLMWMALAGVAAVLVAHPLLFQCVQWVGVLYLAWLGWRMWRAQPGDAPVLQMAPCHYFRQGALITLLNPKAIVFYMAFFPLFVDPAQHRGLLTFAVMALTVALLTALYCIMVVMLTAHMAQRVRSHPWVVQVLNKTAGVFLIGFGLKLAISK